MRDRLASPASRPHILPPFFDSAARVHPAGAGPSSGPSSRSGPERGRWRAVTLWCVVILVATSWPGSSLPAVPSIPHVDKLVHGGLYGALGLLLARAAGPGRSTRWWGRAAAAIAAGAALDEWHQAWIPGRSPDVADWGADVVGALVGVVTLGMARWRRERGT